MQHKIPILPINVTSEPICLVSFLSKRYFEFHGKLIMTKFTDSKKDERINGAIFIHIKEKVKHIFMAVI